MEIALDGGPADAGAAAGEATPVDVDELSRLVAEALEHGQVAGEVLRAALEEADAGREQAVELYAHLEEHGVEIIEVEEAGENEPAESAPVARELDLTVEPSLDSLRL